MMRRMMETRTLKAISVRHPGKLKLFDVPERLIVE